MRDKYGVNHYRYCYSGSDVLINKLNIKDSLDLEEAEVAFSKERYLSYQSNKTQLDHFNFGHLKHLHFVLFQDLYRWAGQLRDVDISKGNTRFCTYSRIEPEANKLFSQIASLSTANNKEHLITQAADLFCEMNLLHPFREGNGRTLRFFFEEMLFVAGYDVVWPVITPECWIEANIAGVHFDLAPLKNIFHQAITLHKN
ncbi:Fic/DOC family protein [Vibrio algicola]|uniref:protein adenylyltransferase n=1 Tax=Vibrio algicola TaxID=2662262 RepID=A0A5Q0TIE5_9VIBR|nr:Fic family protein [Vibrio algicola]